METSEDIDDLLLDGLLKSPAQSEALSQVLALAYKDGFEDGKLGRPRRDVGEKYQPSYDQGHFEGERQR